MLPSLLSPPLPTVVFDELTGHVHVDAERHVLAFPAAEADEEAIVNVEVGLRVVAACWVPVDLVVVVAGRALVDDDRVRVLADYVAGLAGVGDDLAVVADRGHQLDSNRHAVEQDAPGLPVHRQAAALAVGPRHRGVGVVTDCRRSAEKCGDDGDGTDEPTLFTSGHAPTPWNKSATRSYCAAAAIACKPCPRPYIFLSITSLFKERVGIDRCSRCILIMYKSQG